MEKLEQESLQKKVRSVIKARKKQKLEKHHLFVDQYSTFEEEKRLKNASRKGVVKLFNAINKHQKILAKELSGKQQNPDKGKALFSSAHFLIFFSGTTLKG